ncbi:hypothetical protein [Anaerohalosphaera lusitana]|nr:hypothetical protein [Anaerohalosphaera lusitana]
MPFSVAELLMNVCAELENSMPESILLPLSLPWSHANTTRKTQKWPVKTVLNVLINQLNRITQSQVLKA